MAKFFDAFKKGMNAMAESDEGQRYQTAGKEIVCPHCTGIRFKRGEAQLNTAGMSFLNLDWADKSATTLACSNCGYILWFVHEVEEI